MGTDLSMHKPAQTQQNYQFYGRKDLFSSVRSKRIFAFLIDFIAISIVFAIAFVAVFVLGIVTLGLGFLLYAILWPAVALGYICLTLGGANSATPGMRSMGLQMRRTNGTAMDPAYALAHTLLFYFSVSLLTPLVLLVSLLSNQKRLLHDIVLGTIVINTAAPVDLTVDTGRT
ncbi:RDD family protein [Polycladidibacter hongkongensis]|uniref:RDD family protein n=1 Tax=Polycladidibacter hongkongensis TaxID=1647556 RepID=UPI000836A0AC|nr:RDD family protein [Pseudovibrio hongkongensis]